ncbi:hypothetical protein AK812_SmicGene10669 [Symbiodinium microadriaticum]|uniref:Uncharacterized protein n=1 Tax=Symbiodinium microadriaticum TaxID=2951 RepID=A0A1Q9EF50_SYMMI|nr:hypothetical protein AK812_SmicGene10669 [Symbiodinium microadriaticum]
MLTESCPLGEAVENIHTSGATIVVHLACLVWSSTRHTGIWHLGLDRRAREPGDNEVNLHTTVGRAQEGGCARRGDYCTIGSNELEGMPVVGRWSGMSGARRKPLHELSMQVIGLVLAGACVSPPAVADTVLDSVLLDVV